MSVVSEELYLKHCIENPSEINLLAACEIIIRRTDSARQELLSMQADCKHWSVDTNFLRFVCKQLF
jgi:hypothetical protein